MLTTVGSGGHLHSRPLAALDAQFDGDLWLFVSASGDVAHDVRMHQAVNVTYASPDETRHLSVCGTGSIVVDADKARRLWRDEMAAWFAAGPDDPDLALLRVRAIEAGVWITERAPRLELTAAMP